MASEWNLWVWLEYIGAVIIIVTFPTPLVLALFLAAVSYFFVHFLNVFSFLFMLFL